MPYDIKKTKGGYFVYNKDSGRKFSKSPHKTMKSAKKQLAALHINVKESYDEVCSSLLQELFGSTANISNPNTTSSYKNPPTSQPPKQEDVDLDNPDHQLAAWELAGNKTEDWNKLSPTDKKKFVDTAKQSLSKSVNVSATNTNTAPPSNTAYTTTTAIRYLS